MSDAYLTDDDIFSSSPVLTDDDVFGAPEQGGFLSKAGNIAAGVGERVGDLGGGLLRTVAGVAETGGDWLERRVPLGAIEIGSGGVKWRSQSEEEIAAPSNVTTLGQAAAKKLEAADFGYEPATTWEDVKSSPVKQFIPFALEQGLISLPDATAAVLALPAYITARTGEMGQERAKNDGAENARVDDLLKVLPAAVASALFERLGAKGMFGLDEAAGGVAKRAVKAGVKEAGTEAAQESVEYAGTNLGTEKGFDPAEMGERALAGAVAGGTFGAAVGGTTAAGEKALGGRTQTAQQPSPVLSDEEVFAPAPAEKPAAVTPAEREQMVVPPPSLDRERADSPRLTPEDRASPISNDLIDDGKAIIEQATKGEVAPVAPASVEERAMLRKAGSADDEIDVMSPVERQAEVQQAQRSGVTLTDDDIFSADIYERPATEQAQERASIPLAPEASPVAEAPVAPAVEPVQAAPIPRRDMDQDVAVTASGREVPVRYAVVEAKSLVASQRDEGGSNASYPAELQPRDRERAVSQTQIQSISQNLNPRLLDKSPRASDGAPIISADGVVESGNGRVLAIRRAYASGKAETYRQHLAAQGYPVDGVAEPVLVRVREGELAPADRQAFTREANERDTLAMSATEQAMADSSAMSDNLIALYRGGDVDAASNRDFVRSFIRDVVGQNDQARMIGADGALSQEAVRRVQAGLLGKAYGDADLVSSLVESTDTNIKAIGGALMDVSAEWAQMRAEAKAGTISPSVDLTSNLLEAVRLVQRARTEGRKLSEYVGQADIFSGSTLSPEALGFLNWMFRNRQSWTQPTGRDRLSDTLRYYVDEARKTSAGTDLLGESAPAPKTIMAAAERRQDGRTDEKQAGLDFKAPAAAVNGKSDRPSSPERAVEPEPARAAQDRDAAPRTGDQAAGEVTRPPSIVYHGTSSGGFDTFDAYGGRYGLFGSGGYFTEDPDIALEYTRKGKGQTPTVYAAKLSVKNPLNMDAPADVAAWEKAFPDYLDASVLPANPTNEQVYREIEEALSQEMIPDYEGAEIMQGGVMGMGHDAITHIGGGRHKASKGTKHRVWIVFDDDQVSNLVEERRFYERRRQAENAKPDAFRIREAVAGVETEFLLTEAFRDQAASLSDKLRSKLDGLGLKDVGLRVSESISAIINGERFAADGRYFRKVIDIALDADDPVSTLNHEAIHALRRLDLFTETEWAILSRKSKADWLRRYNIAERYDGFPDWAQVEEGIAHAYADWSRGVQVPGIIARSFKRIKAFIEALRNALTGLGFKTSDSVFEKVSEGETGQRVRDQFGRFADPSFALVERRNVVDEQGIPRVRAVTKSLGQSIMRSIKRGKDDGETIGDYTHRKLIDYLQPLKVMIEKAGGAPQETMDAYLQARLAEDASLARIQGIHDAYVTPMVDELAKAGASLEDLHRYAYAQHAEERNRVVGLRNEPGSDFYKAVKDPSIKGASGWSTNEARKALRELQADPKKAGGLARAYKLMRAMIDQSLLDQKKAGLISADTYSNLTSQWSNYVPLRSEEGDGDGLPGRGSGFDVRGKEFKGATGRTTEAENITVWAIASAERAVLRAEKNSVGKAMLRFINHVDPKGENVAKVYWTGDEPLMDIDKAQAVFRRELGKSGQVINKKVPPSTISPDMFAVKIGGRSYYVEFADPKVGLALKKLGQPEIGAVSRLMRHVTVWQSIINTRANPAFVPVNILRDAMTGGIHLLDEGFSPVEAAKIVTNIPKAWGALWRNVRGKPGSSEWDRALKEYVSAGGKITFENNRTVEDSIKLLQKRYGEALNGKSTPKKLWDTFADFWGDLNDAGENGMRLAAYVAAREKGRTIKQAAFLGRDLTVDFKKHGEVGPTMNSWFVFFNASLQGNYNIAKRLATSKKVRQAAIAIAAQGVLIDLLNRSLSGDDDDGESYYSKLVRNEGYKLERQIVLFYGPGETDYFTIPLPYGYNALYHLGTQVGAVAHGDLDPVEAVGNAARVTFDAYNPLGSGGSLLNMALPTVLDPVADIATNVNFFGAPIYPTSFPGDTKPESESHFSTTPDVFRYIASAINAASGGGDVEPGAIDIHPDTYEHMWDFVSGGIGRFLGQTYETGEKLVTGQTTELEPENIPFVRSFFGRMDDDDKRAEYYRQREEVQAAKSAIKAYRESGRGDDADQFIERNRVQVQSIGAFDGAEKELRKIRKAKRAIDLSKDLSRAEKTEKLRPLQEAEINAMNRGRMAYAKHRAEARQ